MIKVGIDVDETIIYLKPKWSEWIYEKFNTIPDFSKEILNENWLFFWKNESLYDDIKPISEAVDVINWLYNTGQVEIVFISHCFKEHKLSKINLLKKYFKFHSFIDTKDKYLCDIDILIDDRDIFFREIKKQNLDIITILHKTEYKSKNISDYEMNWYEIKDYFKDNVLK